MKIATIFTTGLLIASISLLSGCSDEADSATATGGTSPTDGSLGDSTPQAGFLLMDFLCYMIPLSQKLLTRKEVLRNKAWSLPRLLMM